MMRARVAACCAAHPRAGGENQRMKSVAASFTGSSPRGRGKQGFCGLGIVDSGLIPARAGKTVWLITSQLGKSAHPRAGGENLRP